MSFCEPGISRINWKRLLSELLVMRLYLEWGLEKHRGLTIDSESATVASLIEKGPEVLAAEMAQVIQAESALSREERKNF